MKQVFPRVSAEVKQRVLDHFPNVRLHAEPGFVPLENVPVVMLVAFTGTGKSTTLEQLAALRSVGQAQFADDLPGRREIADLVIIPTAQVISGEMVQSVTGREERFEYTRRFAHSFEPGGSAAVYRWFYYRWDARSPVFSDGVRGPGEIGYVLQHLPVWRVIELWVDPLVRLCRLTKRSDKFDQLSDLNREIDLSFLPEDARSEALKLLAAGEISPKAIRTARAEALNYGAQPYDRTNTTPHYYFLNVGRQSPQVIAGAILEEVRSDRGPG